MASELNQHFLVFIFQNNMDKPYSSIQIILLLLNYEFNWDIDLPSLSKNPFYKINMNSLLLIYGNFDLKYYL